MDVCLVSFEQVSTDAEVDAAGVDEGSVNWYDMASPY